MEKMNKKVFMEDLCRLIQERLGEKYRVKIQEVNKNNNVKFQGLLILTEESNVTPTIYLDSFYEAYLEGTSLESIIEVILQIYREDMPGRHVDMAFFKNFEQVKDRICYKLINVRYNEALLEQIPHVPFLDLAICFYYAYQGEELGDGSILIYNSHMKMWHTSTADLMKLAEKNTPEFFPWELCSMEEVIHGIMKEQTAETGEGLLDEAEEEQFLTDMPMKVLSNVKKLQGAACILYPELLGQIADEIGKNLYILPSSIHEVILLPDNGKSNGGELQALIREVNHTQLEPQEILSDNLYYYNHIEKTIQIFKIL